jgi:hypothetical protein
MTAAPKTKWQIRTETTEQHVRRRADLLLNDDTHNWLRTSRSRRAIVVLYVASTVGMVWLWAKSFEPAALLATLVWGVLLVALRLSVRSQADLPDYVLDERQRAERDRSYLSAYRLVAGSAVCCAAVGLLVVVARDGDNGEISLGYGPMTALFWGTFSVVVAAPSLALATRQQGPG